jgi:LPXTG-motif cell wall-anchored protein
MPRAMAKRRKRGSARESGTSRKLWLFLFGVAGLGVGVWLFRSKRKGTGGSQR